MTDELGWKAKVAIEKKNAVKFISHYFQVHCTSTVVCLPKRE